ncbi:MAG: VOC family protein [Chloroflexota bacterium]|nr:VOC family protein [Chloroflexota bacterium]
MKIAFVAGFGPIVSDMEASTRFYTDALGISFEGDDTYRHTDKLDGVRAFSLWPLREAARSCFGTDAWPTDLPVPQAWMEFDVESADAVHAASAELEQRGYRPLAPAKTEEWGQTVVHLLSPEGLLLGVSFTPWMH